jgi:hypothetical protein
MKRNKYMVKLLGSLVGILASGAVSAITIDVQPIQVCDDAGANCASVNTFSSYFNKIYAQRGDTLNFLPTKQLSSSAYLNLETTTEADQLIRSTTGTQRTTGAYDMWFVDSITGGTRAGRAALGGDGVVISDDIIPMNRVDTPAHELGHNIGFGHTSTTQTDAARFLMAPGSIREIPTTLTDVAPDGKQLSRFEPILPTITVDTIGSTPFQNTGFFEVNYLTGAASDLFLDTLTVNLGPANAFTDPTDTPPGEDGSPFGLSSLNGISASDISVSGISDGSQSFTLTLATGSFAPSDSFAFGVDMDLLSNIDGFGATPAELEDALISFGFSNGYSITQSLDDQIAISFIDPLANIDKPALIFSDPDPLFASQVPEPSMALLLAMGGLVFMFCHKNKTTGNKITSYQRNIALNCNE